MKLSTLFFTFIITLYSFSQSMTLNGKNIMLILGPDNMQTIKYRINIGYKLYNSPINFDYVIVSGGCGAHKSNICEASEMMNLLLEKCIML